MQSLKLVFWVGVAVFVLALLGDVMSPGAIHLLFLQVRWGVFGAVLMLLAVKLDLFNRGK